MPEANSGVGVDPHIPAVRAAMLHQRESPIQLLLQRASEVTSSRLAIGRTACLTSCRRIGCPGGSIHSNKTTHGYRTEWMERC